MLLDRGITRRIVISLVQSEVLLKCLRVRTLNDNGLNGQFQQLGVVNVGTAHDHTQGSTIAVDDHTMFAAIFLTICGIWADTIPPKCALPMEPLAACYRS